MRTLYVDQWTNWIDKELGESLYTRLCEEVSMSQRNESIKRKCGRCQRTLVATAKEMKAHAEKCAGKKK